jgi:uncharacterized protein (TIGR02147 family)
MNPNEIIASYTDYRAFLRDYYESRKKSVPHFSYQMIAEGAGFASASFVRMVIEGKKNLTEESIARFAKALGLNKKSAAYFRNIVLFCQAKDIETKALHLKKIDGFRKRNKPELLLPEEYDYLKNWLHAVVREAVELPGAGGDTEKIAGRLLVPVSQAVIKSSIEFLVQNKFLARDRNGALVRTDKTITTADIPQREEIVLIAKKYHLQMLEFARTALLELPKEERSITNTTLSISEKTFGLAVKRIEALRYELLELAASDNDADRVCQLNINFFPIVKKTP